MSAATAAEAAMFRSPDFMIFLPLLGRKCVLPVAAGSDPATASLTPLSQVQIKLSIADSLAECETEAI
jgi:hypothetical protein